MRRTWGFYKVSLPPHPLPPHLFPLISMFMLHWTIWTKRNDSRGRRGRRGGEILNNFPKTFVKVQKFLVAAVAKKKRIVLSRCESIKWWLNCKLRQHPPYTHSTASTWPSNEGKNSCCSWRTWSENYMHIFSILENNSDCCDLR